MMEIAFSEEGRWGWGGPHAWTGRQSLLVCTGVGCVACRDCCLGSVIPRKSGYSSKGIQHGFRWRSIGFWSIKIQAKGFETQKCAFWPSLGADRRMPHQRQCTHSGACDGVGCAPFLEACDGMRVQAQFQGMRRCSPGSGAYDGLLLLLFRACDGGVHQSQPWSNKACDAVNLLVNHSMRRSTHFQKEILQGMRRWGPPEVKPPGQPWHATAIPSSSSRHATVGSTEVNTGQQLHAMVLLFSFPGSFLCCCGTRFHLFILAFFLHSFYL